MVKGAVDVCRFDWDQLLGAHQARRLSDDAHGHGRAVAIGAGGKRRFVAGKSDRHEASSLA